MAILVANDGSRFVDTMEDRDAIPVARRFMGMRVTVKDAIGDPVFGGGVVQYLWDRDVQSWSPVWSDKKPELKFATEEKTITAGKVTTTHVIKDGLVWNARVMDTDGTILGDAQLVIEGKNLTLQSEDYNGKTLHYTYAYGEMTTELIEIWETKADLGSPALTGKPTAPTAAVSSNDTTIATTAFVKAAVDAIEGPEAAPVDGKEYVQKDGAWVELSTDFESYSLKSGVSATGTLAVDVATQQAWSVTNTSTAGRTISLQNGPAGKMVTVVLVINGASGDLTWSGSNIKWGEDGPVAKADLGATKTVIAFLWDGVDTWIGTKGAAY